MDPLNRALVMTSGAKQIVQVGSTNTNSAGNNVTSLACNVPTGTQNGDLMVAFLSGNSGANDAGNWDSSGTTWTWAIERVVDTWINMTIAYRVANNEGSTVTFTSSGSIKPNISIVTFRNAQWGLTGTEVNGNSTTSTASSITVPVGNSLLIGYWLDNDGVTVTNDTGLSTVINSPTMQVSHLVATSYPVAAGATGTKTLTRATSKQWAAVLCSLSPF